MNVKQNYGQPQLYFRCNGLIHVSEMILDFLMVVGRKDFPFIRTFSGIIDSDAHCWKIENDSDAHCWKIENINKQAVLKGLQQ